MPRKITVSERDSFRVPEDRERRKLLVKIRPLLGELAAVTRTEEQREIDNLLMETASGVIGKCREAGLDVSAEDMEVDPLWKEAVLTTDRTCRFNFGYGQASEGEGGVDTSVRVDINRDGVELAVKIRRYTPFSDFLSPDGRALLMRNDKTSQELDLDIQVSASEPPTLTLVQIQPSGDVVEAEREGGFFEVAFGASCGHGSEEIGDLVQRIRSASDEFARGSLFEHSHGLLKKITDSGNVIDEPRQISEREAVELIAKHSL
jgi:hypothetical protein